jgi:hypothetical protein
VDEIHVLLLIGNIQDVEQQPHFVAASRQFEIVQLSHDAPQGGLLNRQYLGGTILRYNVTAAKDGDARAPASKAPAQQSCVDLGTPMRERGSEESVRDE